MLDRTPSEKHLKFGFTQITYPVSGEALEEARGISNIEFSDVLFSAIAGEKDTDVKGRLYFILTSLAVNTKNSAITAFLIPRLLIEKDKFVLEEILSCLGKMYKPATMGHTSGRLRVAAANTGHSSRQCCAAVSCGVLASTRTL